MVSPPLKVFNKEKHWVLRGTGIIMFDNQTPILDSCMVIKGGHISTSPRAGSSRSIPGPPKRKLCKGAAEIPSWDGQREALAARQPRRPEAPLEPSNGRGSGRWGGRHWYHRSRDTQHQGRAINIQTEQSLVEHQKAMGQSFNLRFHNLDHVD